MQIPISYPQNIFFDGRNIDDSDLKLEQKYNNQVQASIVNNHFGSGVLPNSLIGHMLFDSGTISGLLDGIAIFAQNQPSDNNNGNQIDIELIGSSAAGKRTVKVLVVGLDFENNLQYDTFTFNKNEKQVSSKHYKTILTLFFNDLIGIIGQSFNLGGKVIIKEANPLTLSRDCKMLAQDQSPNLFFRDFVISGGGSLSSALSTALPSYNIGALNINTGYSQLRSLNMNDVSSQIGEKFLATTNNIEKITILMSVINNITPSNLVWTGDLLISVYQLQSSVSCSSDIVPNSAIAYDPSNIPLAQLSVSYDSLYAAGTILNTVPQPVDFIFSNTGIGAGILINPGSYYLVSVKRAGTADTCNIQFPVGVNSDPNSRDTLFNGTIWTDVPNETMWMQVFSDAAKVSDGQAYDAGHGISVPKTQIDPTTGVNEDYSLEDIQFIRNDLYYAVIQAIQKQSAPIEDERTGNEINSQQQLIPNVSLLNSIGLAALTGVSDPLIVGTISDQNVKTYSSTNATLSASFHNYGFVKNTATFKIITDTDGYDGYRYDQNIVELVSELVNGNLNGAKLIPDTTNTSLYYRIAKAELFTMVYGDIDGNGLVDTNDILEAQKLVGSNINSFPTYNQYIESVSYFSSDGYVNWTINNSSGEFIESGSDGIITVNPTDGTLANFKSNTANFISVSNLGTCTITISGSAFTGNNGQFTFQNLVDNKNTTIQKAYYDEDTILKIMRADIDGYGVISQGDVDYISNYINKVAPFPATTSPANRIGTTFQAVRLTLEEYIDRADDYPATDGYRNTDLHTVPDIYLDGYIAFSGDDTLTSPIAFNIVKQLLWNESSIVVFYNPRLVPAAFISDSGQVDIKCNSSINTVQQFPSANRFDPGMNSFYVPGNLILGKHSQIVNTDGYTFPIDFEVATFMLQIPAINFNNIEYSINIFTDLVADYTGTGLTRLGYRSMRFFDCSTVGMNALGLNQVKFDAALQSFSPNLNGIDGYQDGYACLAGIIVDGKIGVNLDYSTGVLKLNFDNLFQDIIKETLNTKIQIKVYLKKSGFVNTDMFVPWNILQNIIELPTPTPDTTICPDPTIIVVG